MSWIKIPEGKTEVRLADGSWTNIPEGVSEVDSSKLWSENQEETIVPEVDMNTKQAPIPSEATLRESNVLSDIYSGIQNAEEAITQPFANTLGTAVRGATRPALGLLRFSEDIANSIGIDTNAVKDMIQKNESQISKNLQEMGLENDSFINPANAGQIFAEVSPLAKVNKLGTMVKTEAGMGASSSYGEGNTVGEALVDGTISGVTVGAIGGIGKMAKKVMDKNKSALTDEAKTVASKIGISEEEALEKVSGLEKSEQAFELAKQGGGKTKGLMEGALSDSKEAKLKYLEEMTARRKAILESAGSSDYNRMKNATKREFTVMKEYVDDISSASYDASKFVDELEMLKKTGSKTTATDRNIESMIDSINEQPTKSAGDLVELRAEINHELSKATGDRAIKWKSFKNDLDAFMKNNIDKEVYDMIETSTSSYRRMKQQGELLDLIKSSQKVVGESTQGEVGAINWSALGKAMKESGLDSPEARNAMRLTKKFNLKFGDMDANLFAKSLPSKTTDVVQTFTSDPASALKVLANRTGVSWLMRQFDADKSAQKVIADAMEKSNTQAEFFNNVIQNKNTPKRVKDEMKALLDGVADVTPENVKKQKMISVAKQKEARDVQIKVNSADLAIQKQEDKLFEMEERLSKYENNYVDKPSDALESRIQRLEKQISLANKDLEIKIQKHSKYKETYDKLSVDIEDMNLFNPMRKKVSRPKVTSKTE